MSSAFWYATSLAILNYPTDFYDFIVSGQVNVYREDISHLSHHTVNLADGTTLDSSAGLVAGANWSWKPNIDFLPTSIHSDLGISSTEYTSDQQDFWADLDRRAQEEILEAIPRLKTAPHRDDIKVADPNALTTSNGVSRTSSADAARLQPFRLFRFLAPPGLTAQGDRSIAFAGFTTNLLGHIRNEIAGLWIYAYMNNKLSADIYPGVGQPDYHYNAALTNRYCKLRFPYGFGSRFPDFVFEQIPWFDVLLRDLGLEARRKGPWWREWFVPYGQSDYRGLTAEWLGMTRAKGLMPDE